MNFSGSGASLSLGGRGATINVSSRGTRATVGIPGTGLSYSASSTSGSPRRRSTQQLAAAHRRMLQEQQHANALAEIERNEQELLETVSDWRRLLAVTPPEAITAELKERPFSNSEPAPQEPSFSAAERLNLGKAERQVRTEMALQGWRRFLWAIVGVATFVVGAPFYPLVAFLVAWPAAVVAFFAVYSPWLSRIRPVWQERARQSWPAVRTELEAQHAQAVAAYVTREHAARAGWIAADQQRIAELRRLVMGEVDAIEQAVSASIEEIDFPFEALCAVAVDDEDHVLIDVDLPEIEDVIPETQLRALKNGTLSEKKRKVSERNELYAELVCGIAFAIAATTLSSAPTVAYVTVAGRTQRQKRASTDLNDDYVYEVKIPRAFFSATDANGFDPVDALRKLPSRIQVAANGALKTVQAPAWVEAVVVPPATRRQGGGRA